MTDCTSSRLCFDTCIRAPFKKGWKRVLLLVKGMITENGIYVQELLHLQSSHRSPVNELKLMSDGFEIDFGRKILSVGEKQ